MAESKKIYFEKDCEDDKTTPKWTNYTKEPELRCETKGQGKLDILILGNSIAYRAYPVINGILKGRYRNLRLYSTSGRPILPSSAFLRMCSPNFPMSGFHPGCPNRG